MQSKDNGAVVNPLLGFAVNRSGFSTTNCEQGQKALSMVVKLIREGGDNGSLVETMRHLRNGVTDEQAAELKATLPVVLPAGTLTEAREIATPSGLLALDFDRSDNAEKLPDLAAAKKVRDALHAAEPCLAAVFLSPRGGVKALVRIVETTDGRAYAAMHDALAVHFRDKHGLTLCSSVRSMVQPMYLSHDPQIRVRDNPTTWEKSKAPEAAKPKRNVPAKRMEGITTDDFVAWLEFLDPDCPYQLWLTTLMGAKHQWGEGARDLVEAWSMDGQKYDEAAFARHWQSIARTGEHDGKVVTLRTVALEAKKAAKAQGAVLKLPSHLTKQLVIADGDDPAILLHGGDRSMHDVAADIAEFIREGETLFCRVSADRRELLALDDNGEPFLLTKAPQLGEVVQAKGGVLFKKRRKDRASGAFVEVEEQPPASLWDTMFATSGWKRLLKPVRTVLKQPYLVTDRRTGEVVSLQRGYNEVNGGIYVTGVGQSYRMTPEEAAALIEELFHSVTFATEKDRHRALLALLTPALVVGGWVTGPRPLFLLMASAKDSGKSTLARLIASVYGEQTATYTPSQGGVGSIDESVATALWKRPMFLVLDDVGSWFRESGVLNSALQNTGEGTQQEQRIAHVGVVRITAEGTTMFLTSNGFSPTPDLSSRSLRIDLLPRSYPDTSKRYTLPNGKTGNIEDHVRFERGRFLHAIKTLIEQWVSDGKPTTEAFYHKHRCHDWAEIAASVLTHFWPESKGVLDTHLEEMDQITDARILWLRKLSQAVEIGRECTTTELAEICVGDRWGLADPLNREEEWNHQKMGGYLRRMFDSVEGEKISLGGRSVLVRRESWDRKKGRKQHVYVFLNYASEGRSNALDFL